jgi:NADPH-dependent 2,4-dienoyl-CoA reductase/sulfur reductase-like enzyme
MTRSQCDLLIVGAGPAGMAAAAAACKAGLSVVVADEGTAAGGQIYRNVAAAPAELAQWLGKDYVAGRPLVDALHASGARYHSPRSTVWQVALEPEPVAMLTRSGPSGGTLEIGARVC